jgi:SulP family sulfate permease
MALPLWSAISSNESILFKFLNSCECAGETVEEQWMKVPYDEGLRDRLLPNLGGDLSGALTAAIITLPMSIGYGIIAFAPLGVEFAPRAALLGVYSAVFVGILAGAFGGTPIQISGPKAPLTLVLATFMAGMSAKLSVSPQAALQPEILIGLAGVCVMIAGLCQVIFGSLGVGNLVKYVPQPVVAGFMNGIAFLLIVKQIRPILGVRESTPLIDIVQHPDLINPLTAMVGFVTIAAIFISRRYIRRVPASLTALGVGSTLYYGLTHFGGDKATGNVIGRLDVGLPAPDVILQWFPALEQLPYSVLLPELLATGFIIGLLASMESLLASVVSDNLTGSRHNSKKEMIGQGLGNMACGIFGALPAAGSIPRSMANYLAGGRSWVSGMLCAVIIFLMIVFLAPIVGKIPLAVIAGIIFVVGVTLFDSWSLNLLQQLLRSFKFRKELIFDLIITLIVAIVTVSINLIAAIAVGIVIASAMFIARMGRSIIKRKYFGSQFHSRKMRSIEHAEALEKAGDQIVIIELQGPLFFGSAENLAVEIENTMPSIQYCILNFKRVNDIDSTGANILSQIKKKMEGGNKYLLLSQLRENPTLWHYLEVMHIDRLLEGRAIFTDTDTALEWAEDHLLGQVQEDQESDQKVHLSQFELFRDFSEEELNTIQTKLALHTYSKGQLVFNEGDDDRDLYLLTKGSMSVKIHLSERNRQKRIFTYTSGTILGEVAFLDGSNRSAGVWAHENSEVLRLPFSQFQTIRTEHPEIATKLITNLSLELSRRLRRTSNQVRLLEDS